MKVQEKLDEIRALVSGARSLPMSSSIVVNKAELSRLLTELGELLPDDLAQAEAVLSRRDAMLYEATANAERLLTATMEERARMISEEEVLREARIEAAELIRDAQERSQRTSREIDEYVDAKLAHLEVSVTTILETVRQGRQRLAQPGLYSELASLPEPGPVPGIEPPPLPRRQVPPEGADSLALGTGTDQAADWSSPQWGAETDGDSLPRWGPTPPAPGLDDDLLVGRANPGANRDTGRGQATAETAVGWTPQRPGDVGGFDEGESAPWEPSAPGGPGASQDEAVATEAEPAGEAEDAAGAEPEDQSAAGGADSAMVEDQSAGVEPTAIEDDSAAGGAESAVAQDEPAVAEDEPAVAEKGPATEAGQDADEVVAERPGADAEQSHEDSEDGSERHDETAAAQRRQEARAE